MRPPVKILKFLAIEGAENRDAEDVKGEEKPTRRSGERRKLPSGVWGRAPAANEFWSI